jgi:hypothetical protein
VLQTTLEVGMERRELERSAARVTYLRGLLAVPLGVVMLASAAGNLEWGPYRNGAVFIATVVAMAAVALGVYRWYDQHYGRVRLGSAQQARFTVASFTCFGIGLSLGAYLDTRLDVPISVTLVLFGLAMLVWFALCVGLRPDHYVVWGGLVVVGLLPLWGHLHDRTSVAWLPMGVAVIVAGLLDHRALVQNFGPARADVGA